MCCKANINIYFIIYNNICFDHCYYFLFEDSDLARIVAFEELKLKNKSNSYAR